jgi:hypothetical protein
VEGLRLLATDRARARVRHAAGAQRMPPGPCNLGPGKHALSQSHWPSRRLRQGMLRDPTSPLIPRIADLDRGSVEVKRGTVEAVEAEVTAASGSQRARTLTAHRQIGSSATIAIQRERCVGVPSLCLPK